MSDKFPHDRARARTERGEQPFKDAKEEFAQKEAELRKQEVPRTERDQDETEEQYRERIEREMSEQLGKIDSAGTGKGDDA
jgi:hypothetical protein